ncbi:N-acetylmuramoyl-L-alanine amidase [Streptosporangium canum]|uniref:peptidoglycan recognition protein family protein n=1 Tax=Streptosporangium canum TaxID=324952 RepID=UPI00342BDC3C
MKIHYVGSYVNPAIVDDCDRCTALVRSIQIQHQDSNDWTDVAYNLLVCPHRRVFVGRGPGILSAANGKGLNSGHYAVCVLLGDRGLVQPTAGHLNGIHDAITYLRARGAGPEVQGHRDGYATSCPGPELYRWLQMGMPIGAQQPGKDDTTPIPRPPNPSVPAWPGRMLVYRPGQPMPRGEDVRAWQRRLKVLRYTIADDGIFGPTSSATTKVFQRQEHLAVDGIVGPLTWRTAWK